MYSRDAAPLARCLTGAAWVLRAEGEWDNSGGYLVAHTGLLVR